MGEQDSFAISM